MIDDIVQMVFKEARERRGKDLIQKISDVRITLNLFLDNAVERLEKEIIDKVSKAYKDA
ncbi:MAG: hypothetical protein KAV87_19935 [Desulfobacteraceae bacterium]|nr:hypothetical protein [Desulfobacteraceae bacterium]